MMFSLNFGNLKLFLKAYLKQTIKNRKPRNCRDQARCTGPPSCSVSAPPLSVCKKLWTPQQQCSMDFIFKISDACVRWHSKIPHPVPVPKHCVTPRSQVSVLVLVCSIRAGKRSTLFSPYTSSITPSAVCLLALFSSHRDFSRSLERSFLRPHTPTPCLPLFKVLEIEARTPNIARQESTPVL